MIDHKNYPQSMLFALIAGIAMLFSMAQPSLAANDLAPSVYWQLEETDPGTAGVIDDLTVVNGACTTCPASTTGQVDLGFDFFGVDAEVDFATNAIFDFAVDDSFSIELWMKIAAAPGATQVMIGRSSAGTIWWLGVNDSGNLAAFFRDADNGAGTSTITTTANVANDAWHHVVAVLDRDAGAGGQILLYVDGESVATVDLEDVNSGAYTAASAVTLGYFDTAPFFYFAGQLDNVAIYSANALTAIQVAQSFASGSGGFSLDELYPPLFTGTRAETVAAGFPLTFTATATGNPAPDNYASTDLPFGATIESATGVISWLPSNLDTGPPSNEFTVTATNSEGTGNQDWAIDVEDLCTSALDTYFKLETDGGPFADDQGVAVSATCTVCPTQVTGKVGFGQSFDGVDRVDIPANAVFDWADTASFSIELWTNIAAAPTGTQVMIGRFSANTRWWLGVNNLGNLVAFFRDVDGGAGTSTITTTTNLSNGEWRHVAAVLDRDAGAGGQILLYVDGESAATVDLEAVNNGAYTAASAVTLGYFDTGFDFEGTLDEIATYNMALTDNMVKQHFNAAPGQSYCNAAPTITSTEETTATQGEAYSYTATATDPESQAITWSLATRPTGMEIDANTGVVTWTPDSSATASENVVIVATDVFGAADSQTFDIDVTLVDNTAPSITSTAPATATIGVVYTYSATATDADAGNTLTWSLAAGAPTGMAVNAATGEVTWTPDAAGDFNYTLNVSDGIDTVSQPVTVTVSAASSGGGGGGGGGCFINSLY